MFLFLSKLLPIFIYPLGLSSLLMLLALVILWKRPRWAAAVISLAWIILLLGSNGWVAQGLVRSLEWQNCGNPITGSGCHCRLRRRSEAAISPRPWVDVSEAGDQILHGAATSGKGKRRFSSSAAGALSGKEAGLAESEDMAKIAETMGVPKDAILQDPTSLNTHENAVNVRKILDSQGIRRQVLLVTSAMHMPRSLLIFKRQGIQATPAPTDFLVSEQELQEINSSWQSTLLNILPDADNLQQTTKALKEYIGLVVYRLRGWL